MTDEVVIFFHCKAFWFHVEIIFKPMIFNGFFGRIFSKNLKYVSIFIVM